MGVKAIEGAGEDWAVEKTGGDLPEILDGANESAGEDMWDLGVGAAPEENVGSRSSESV